MVDITLIELHTDGSQIGPRSLPGMGSRDADEETTTTRYTDVEQEDDDGGRGVLPMLLVAGVLLGLGLLARKKFTGDEEPETVPLAESDEISATADGPRN